MGSGLEQEPTTCGRVGRENYMCELSPALFDTRKLTSVGWQYEFCLTCHTCQFSHWDNPLFISFGQHTAHRDKDISEEAEKNYHTLVFRC